MTTLSALAIQLWVRVFEEWIHNKVQKGQTTTQLKEAASNGLQSLIPFYVIPKSAYAKL